MWFKGFGNFVEKLNLTGSVLDAILHLFLVLHCHYRQNSLTSSLNSDHISTIINFLQPPAHSVSPLADFSTLKMEAICSSETSVNARCTQRQIPEDDILQFYASLFERGSFYFKKSLRWNSHNEFSFMVDVLKLVVLFRRTVEVPK
jgi:hypothetical protein